MIRITIKFYVASHHCFVMSWGFHLFLTFTPCNKTQYLEESLKLLPFRFYVSSHENRRLLLLFHIRWVLGVRVWGILNWIKDKNALRTKRTGEKKLFNNILHFSFYIFQSMCYVQNYPRWFLSLTSKSWKKNRGRQNPA